MKRKRLSKSLRKYIRQEKARIRREVLSLEAREEKILELYQKFFKEAKDTSVIPKQLSNVTNHNENSGNI